MMEWISDACVATDITWLFSLLRVSCIIFLHKIFCSLLQKMQLVIITLFDFNFIFKSFEG